MKINDLYATIQGEGAKAGEPIVLVRLMGCPVGCPWCDTKETWHTDPDNRVTILEDALGTNGRWIDASPDTIAARARQAGPAVRWALVTGGEPADQPLRPLVLALRERYFRSALETSGTALGHVDAQFDWVCVSPKFDMPGGRDVLPAALAVADEIKLVVCTVADIHRLETFLVGVPLKAGHIISLQPVSQQPKATQLCVEMCLDRGWRLSLQAHKYLDVR